MSEHSSESARRASVRARSSRVIAQGSGLTNHLLIAMPSLVDPNFAQTVALICEHTDRGALGIVLNKPLPMRLSDVLTQMKLEPSTEDIAAQPVLRGGPVHTDRGFVLHRPGGQWDHTHKVSETIQVTTSRDVLAAMARGEGPGGCLHRARLRRLGVRPARARDPRERLDLHAGRCARGVRAAVRGALDRRLAAARHRCRPAEPGRRACLSKPVEAVLAFDFGLRRIGIAAGDTLTAHRRAPPRRVRRPARVPTGSAIAREIDALKPQRLIVGAPYNVDGTPGALAPAARRFATELEHRFELPVSMVDERWSSLEAGAALKARRAGGGRRRIRREEIDSAAAAVILERWLAGESWRRL